MTLGFLSRSHLSVLSILAAMAVIGFIDNFVPIISRELGLWQFQILRSLIALPVVIAAWVFGLGTLRAKSFRAVTLYSVLRASGVALYFASLGFVSIAVALSGLMLAPIFVVLYTALFRGIHVGPVRYIAVIIGFIGTLLVVNITSDEFHWAAILAVTGGLLYALSVVVTRDYCPEESTLAMLLNITIVQIVISSLALGVIAYINPAVPDGSDGFILRVWVWPVVSAWPAVTIQAIGSLIAVALGVRAYQWGEASYLAVFEYSVFLFGLASAWMLFGQVPEMMQLVGIGLIAIAGAVIAFRI